MQPQSLTKRHQALLSLAIKTAVNAKSQIDTLGSGPAFHTVTAHSKHIYRIREKYPLCLCNSQRKDLVNLYCIWLYNQKKLCEIPMDPSLFCDLRPFCITESLIAKLYVHKLISSNLGVENDPLQIAIHYLCQKQVECCRHLIRTYPKLTSDTCYRLMLCQSITLNIFAMMAVTNIALTS